MGASSDQRLIAQLKMRTTVALHHSTFFVILKKRLNIMSFYIYLSHGRNPILRNTY